MGIRKKDFKPNQRVLFGEHEVTVIEVKPREIVIRNQFGYLQSVKATELRSLEA